MKTMEFVRMKHNLTLLCSSAVIAYEHIKDCKTVAQWESAANYIDNWKTLSLHKEHLDEYSGWKKFLSLLFGNREHACCKDLIETQWKSFRALIDKKIEQIENIEDENNQ